MLPDHRTSQPTWPLDSCPLLHPLPRLFLGMQGSFSRREYQVGRHGPNVGSQYSRGPPAQGRCDLGQPVWSVLPHHNTEGYPTSSQSIPSRIKSQPPSSVILFNCTLPGFFLPPFLQLPLVILEYCSSKLLKPFSGACPEETHTNTNSSPSAFLTVSQDPSYFKVQGSLTVASS